jgi:hypothetical protein
LFATPAIFSPILFQCSPKVPRMCNVSLTTLSNLASEAIKVGRSVNKELVRQAQAAQPDLKEHQASSQLVLPDLAEQVINFQKSIISPPCCIVQYIYGTSLLFASFVTFCMRNFLYSMRMSFEFSDTHEYEKAGRSHSTGLRIMQSYLKPDAYLRK